MEKIKYISKRWSISLRDFLNSIYYGVAVPVLFGIQDIIANHGFNLTKDSLLEKIGMLIISAVLAHIIRKATEKSKEITIKPIESEGLVKSANSRTNPPPMGDPTHPKK